MKPRLYLFLSSLVFVLRIIIFLLKIIPFESFKLLKFPRQQVDLFDFSASSLWHLTKKILVLIMSPLVGNFKKKKYLLKKFKNLIFEVCLIMCVCSRQIVSKGLMDTAVWCCGSSCTATDCNYTPARKAGADPQRGKWAPHCWTPVLNGLENSPTSNWRSKLRQIQ